MSNYAALDIGTNSFHLIIAEKRDDNSFNIIDRQREVIRLGSHSGKDLNIISDDETKLAVTVLKRFAELVKSYKAEIFAAATSAVRESQNGREFINRIFNETGIKINVIDGEKEALLIYKGAEKALGLENRKSLCIDIGGGSSEYILGDSGKIVFAESVKAGAVRMSKKFFPGYKLSPESIDECREYVESGITSNSKINFEADFEIAAGTSGTIISIARMIYIQKYNELPSSLNNYSFSKEELHDVCEEVTSKATVEERKKIKGIEEKRADILPAGLIILKTVFRLFNIREMKISEYALREGIIMEMMKKGPGL